MSEEHRRVSMSEATPSWLQEIRNYWAELAQVHTEPAPQTDRSTARADTAESGPVLGRARR